MSVRSWHIAQALGSYTSLGSVVNELTEEEVMRCLEIEASSQRRRSVINRLIMRAVRLHSVKLNRQLKEKYHASPQLQDHVHRR